MQIQIKGIGSLLSLQLCKLTLQHRFSLVSSEAHPHKEREKRKHSSITTPEAALIKIPI